MAYYSERLSKTIAVWRTYDQIAQLLRIALYIASVYVPMSLRIQLNPRAPQYQSNILLLRDLLLDLSE